MLPIIDMKIQNCADHTSGWRIRPAMPMYVIPAEAGIQRWRGEGSVVLPRPQPLDSGFRRNDVYGESSARPSQ